MVLTVVSMVSTLLWAWVLAQMVGLTTLRSDRRAFIEDYDRVNAMLKVLVRSSGSETLYRQWSPSLRPSPPPSPTPGPQNRPSNSDGSARSLVGV